MSVAGCEKFYGRKTILGILKKRVIDFKDGYRQNVALIGDRYIGKTHILHKFLNESAAKDLVQVYVDAEYKDVDYFCQKICGAVLYEFSKIRSLPLYDDLNVLIESTQKPLPKTIASIKRIQKYLSYSKKFEAYKETIELAQIFSMEAGLFCVFVFDEFHCMEDWGIPEVFQELGKIIMTQKQSLYVFASSSAEQAQMILSEKLSLLFGNFEMIEVGAFDLRTCQEYVNQHLPKIKIGDDLRGFLIDFTGGHPLYLRLLCERLANLAAIHQQKEIFVPLLLRAVEDVLFDPWGVLSRHFDLVIHGLCTGKGNIIYADILIRLSQDKHQVKDLAGIMGVKQSVISTKMNRLLGMGTVDKSGKSFYIFDRLLRYWLRYVFRARRETVEIDPAHQYKQFQAEFLRAVDDFRVQSKKDVLVRIIELFHCFDDESFQTGSRRYKLPIFDKILSEKKLLQQGCGVSVIRASTAGGDWLFFLNEGEVGEQDLVRTMDEAKRRFAKPKKCVLISLTDLDETARVRALQERMWIWNEEEVRTLLHIYNKPYIVV